MASPWMLRVFSAPVRRDDRRGWNHLGKALQRGPLQCLSQLGGLVSKCRGHLIDIPVPDSPRVPVVTGQHIETGPVTEPPQPQHRLLGACQPPTVSRGAVSAPLGRQQLRGELGQVPWDVARGTISGHGGSLSVEADLVVRPLLSRLYAYPHPRGSPISLMLSLRPSFQHYKSRMSESISPRSSHCVRQSQWVYVFGTRLKYPRPGLRSNKGSY